MSEKRKDLHMVSSSHGSSLLVSKLNIPRARQPLVFRPRLAKELNQGITGKMTLVVAPAGFGKSTAVGEWVRQKGLPAGWISLDKNDNDLLQFWKYLITALDQILPGITDKIIPVLHSMNPLPVEAVITTLIEELNTYPGDYIIVLDDFHLIDNPLIQKSFLFFINHMPENMSVVLISRAEPALNLSKLKARRELKVINKEDLRFTREEIISFCQQRDIQLNNKDLNKLDNNSEGWIAGLHMAALSMQQDGDISRFIENMRGNNLNISAYLAEEVFNSWEEEIQDFLLHTSILDRLTESSCNAITGRVNSGEILEMLAKTNAFIVTLDYEQGWYRYHHLFTEFLRFLVRKKKKYQLPVLHLQAGKWYEENGLILEAIRHFLEGKEYNKAVSLLEKQAPDMLKNMKISVLASWLNSLPEDLLNSSSVLCLAYAWTMSLTGEMEKADLWIKRAELKVKKEINKGCEKEHDNQMLGEVALVKSFLAHKRKDSRLAMDLCKEALSYIPHKSIFGKGFIFNQGEISLLGGPVGNYGQLKQLAEILFESDISQSLRKIATPTGYVPVVLAELFYEWNDIDSALPVLLKGINEAEKEESLGALVPALATLARIKQAQGNLQGALQVIEDGCNKLSNANHIQWLNLLTTFKVQLLLEKGETELANQWVQDTHISIYDNLIPARELEYITLARVLLSQQKYDDALLFLTRLYLLAEKEQRLPGMIEILNLQSIGYLKHGKTHKALEVLESSLLLAEEHGYLRKFINEGKPMLILLSKFNSWQKKRSRNKSKVSSQYVKKLIQLTKEAVTATSRDETLSNKNNISLIEDLTRRELEVLKLLALELSNQEISRRLAIAISTVKAHTSNIYSKLGVTNRTRAVEKARSSGIIT